MPKNLSDRLALLEAQAQDEALPAGVRKCIAFYSLHACDDDRTTMRAEREFFGTLSDQEIDQYLDWSREKYGSDEALIALLENGSADFRGTSP